MRPCTHADNVGARRVGMAVLMGILLGATAAAGDRLPPDPVDDLSRAMKGMVDAGTVESRVDALRTLGDMRRALALEWTTDALKHRPQLVERFQKAMRNTLRDGDLPARLAAVAMIGELGVTVQGKAPNTTLGRDFTDDLAEVVKRGEPVVSEAAARALGKIAPESKTAAATLGPLLASPSPALRLAAADGLQEAMQVLVQLATQPKGLGVQADYPSVARAGGVIVPVAAKGLTDPDPVVRRRCMEAIHSASYVLTRLLGPRTPGSTLVPEALQIERQNMAPLAQALVENAPALARALRDNDPEVRRLAARALEHVGSTREALQRPLGPLPTPAPAKEDRRGGGAGLELELAVQRREVAQAQGDDPLLPGLRKALPALIEAVGDPEERVRLAAIDVLETMGPEAASAVPALTKALRDRNRFVRWSAARTLGKIGPTADTPTATSALVALLEDPDSDVRIATCLALERLGPAARSAVLGLTLTVKGPDAPIRAAALRALVGIGTDAIPALPVVADALGDPDARVRRTAAETLGRFGPAAREFVNALVQALNDSDADVRKAASDALLSVVHGGGK